MKKSVEILQQFWKYDTFRPLQEDIVDSAIYGKDTLAILPTGGGKSICFQVPGMALDGVAIVISPLIALMQDQVQQLNARGIKADFLNSTMTYREMDIALDNARFGNTKFLYLSPERLKSDLFIERFKQMNVSLIVVDEAHCISEWGHDFRPDFLEIRKTREYHPNVPIMALTASATEEVKADIIEQLEMKSPTVIVGKLERKNLIYQSVEVVNKLKEIVSVCQRNPMATGIVYCQTRRSVKLVAQQLRSLKIAAGFYHGGLTSEDRKFMLDEWMNGTLRVMVATNAFGMGIDKPDVRFVLHYEFPFSMEAYYQEAGRAGRDGNDAVATIFWTEEDKSHLKNRLEAKYPDVEKVKKVYSALGNYLSVAINAGKDEIYPLEIKKFATRFKFGIGEIFYSLKLLELGGYLSFTEKSFQPTRMKFSVSNSALYKFQVTNEKYNPLILILVRSYPGIHDYFVSLHEYELRKRLKISQAELRSQLEHLEKFGLIDVNFQTDLPKIVYTQPRIQEQYLRFEPSVYWERKKHEFSKLEKMLTFLETEECRSVFIGNYFDSKTELLPCGKCDSCQQKMHGELSIEMVEKKIVEVLPCSTDEIYELIPLERKKIVSILKSLALSERVKQNEITKKWEIIL